MVITNTLPETLIDAIRYYSDLDVCRNLVATMRWSDGVICPYCQNKGANFLPSCSKWKCKVCRKVFSVKVGTIFEDSPLGLDKWFTAMWLVANAKNGISSCEVARAIGVTQKSAWFMLHRIRYAMKTGSLDKFDGTVEVDETFVGGLEKNKHKEKKLKAGRGSVGKTIVMGVLERAKTEKDISKIRVAIIPNTTQGTLHGVIKHNVTLGAEVFTDAARGYNGLSEMFKHDFVDHAIEYVKGRVHTNSVENFWNLLDRGIRGTYIRPSAQHLLRYVDEQAFRFNHRSGTDLTRFLQTIRQISGKRLTYEELTQAHLQNMVPK